VSHLLSYLRSHQKRNTQVIISSGTQNVKNVSDKRLDSSLQKKMEKSANQQAHISHFGKSGTPYFGAKLTCCRPGTKYYVDLFFFLQNTLELSPLKSFLLPLAQTQIFTMVYVSLPV